MSINLSGIREWDDYYPIVFSIRIPEILDEHRKNGLNLIQYLLLKNYSLRNYLPDLCKIIINKRLKISYNELIFNYIKNIIYPNIYLSPFKYLIKNKIMSVLKKVHKCFLCKGSLYPVLSIGNHPLCDDLIKISEKKKMPNTPLR